MKEKLFNNCRAMVCMAYLFFFISILVPGAQALAANPAQFGIEVLYNGDKAYHTQYINKLEQQLSGLPGTVFSARTLDEFSRPLQATGKENNKLTISVGAKTALKLLESNPSTDLLFVLISKDFFQNSIQAHPTCKIITCHTIFTEQSEARFFALIKAIFPAQSKTGVIFGSIDPERDKRLKGIARKYGINLTVYPIPKGEDVHQSLPTILEEVDVLLSLPDSRIYNSHTIRNILITTLRYKVPVIGYSNSYIKAGATAGIYSSITDIANQTREVIHNLLENSHSVSYVIHSTDFSFDINFWVAQSIELSLPDKDSIEKELYRLTGRGLQ